MTAFWIKLGVGLITEIPMLLVYAIGIWICIKHESSKPNLAKTFKSALLIFLVSNLAGAVIGAWTLTNLTEAGADGFSFKWLGYVVQSVLDLTAWALMLLGIRGALKGSSGVEGV